VTLKLTKVDDLIRHEHAWVGPEDKCFFLREYTARAGYAHGETNDIISNLKKKMDRRGKPEWRWKEWAIDRVGRELRGVIGDKAMRTVTIVPMPPSKCKTDPEYDDRVLQIARIMTAGLSCDVRELVLQRESMPAAHECEEGQRPKPADYFANFYVDEDVATPVPTRILVVDDVLTAGAHFAGIKRRLLERFPEVILFGCFFARRVLPKAEDDFRGFVPDQN